MYESVASLKRLRRPIWPAVVVIGLWSVAIALNSACGAEPQADELRSTKERAAPAATAAELAELVDGNSAFAFDLYRSLGAEDGNLFYSPYSISLALAMTYAGARGETERQMADTLHLPTTPGKLHPRSTPWTSSSPPVEEGRWGKETRDSR